MLEEYTPLDEILRAAPHTNEAILGEVYRYLKLLIQNINYNLSLEITFY